MRYLHPTEELWALSTSFGLSYYIRSGIRLLDFVPDESVCPADVYINKILLLLTIPLTPVIRGGPGALSSSGGKRGTASKVHQGGKGKTAPYTECGHQCEATPKPSWTPIPSVILMISAYFYVRRKYFLRHSTGIPPDSLNTSACELTRLLSLLPYRLDVQSCSHNQRYGLRAFYLKSSNHCSALSDVGSVDSAFWKRHFYRHRDYQDTCTHPQIATRLPFTFALEDFSAWTDQQEYPLLYPSPLNEESVASIGASIDTSSRTLTSSRENDRVLEPDVISHQRRLVNTTAMFRRRGLEAERRRSGHAAALHEDILFIVGEMKDHENGLGLFKPAKIPF
ncbi:uncharacterized protein CCOS01_16436 [Colletotrichum costaricense]|uniref:Uncharacterized protein n=1 Tax=Colletotrichum costaricense TaxID=1209916 RepID=A0AAI9YFI4_9PEZI|nr:uncharacterized protein CCOS01_16436 [Colletotrichum costaricense]KAK1506577.1 hypothetical protein CCOS01_16436 [Colletotrichum costaricense]